MAKFFINRPIVAIVISIIMVIVGVVAILGLPIAQYPNIVPPEIVINTTYVGADAQTVEQSVATPIEQEMSGVDNMNYMYSLNANNGELKLYVELRRKDRPEHRPGARPDTEEPGRLQAAPGGPRLRRHGQEVDGLSLDDGEPLFTQRHIRCNLSGELCLHQPERPDHPRSRELPVSPSSAPASMPCGSG